MAKGGVDATPPPSTGFSNFSQKREELFLQTKFLPVGSSLDLSIFQIGPIILALKLGKGRVLGGWQPPPPSIEQKLTYFSNHEDNIQSQQCWYEVR